MSVNYRILYTHNKRICNINNTIICFEYLQFIYKYINIVKLIVIVLPDILYNI